MIDYLKNSEKFYKFLTPGIKSQVAKDKNKAVSTVSTMFGSNVQYHDGAMFDLAIKLQRAENRRFEKWVEAYLKRRAEEDIEGQVEQIRRGKAVAVPIAQRKLFVE